MARIIQDREDLLKEAVALVQRVELQLLSKDEQLANHEKRPENMVIGFRENSDASFYFTQDDAYHFTANGELRRAFVQGVKYKAEQQKLFALQRQGDSSQLKFQTEELLGSLYEEFKQSYLKLADLLKQAIEKKLYKIVGQVPASADVVSRVQSWLAEYGDQLVLAKSANAIS